MEKNNYKICYFSTFENELNEIIYYVSNVLKNKKASERLLKNIEKSIKERSKNPESYARYERSKKSKFVWYRIYVKNFIIFYTVEDNIMKVAHIIYSRRDIERYI